MISPTIEIALASSLDRVLEDMFFVSVVGESADADSQVMITARLDFTGQPCGSMLLQVTPDAARTIAIDFLAEDEDTITDSQVSDVVCELANMICGAALSQLESETTFSLGSPSVLPEVDLSDFSSPSVRAVDIGNGIVRVFLQFHSES